MIIDRKAIKAAAKEQIKGNIGTYFGLSLVIGLILGAAAYTFVGSILLTGVFEFGLAVFMMNVVRTRKGSFGDGFSGFDRFGASFVAYLLISIFEILWSLLLVFPAIIAAYRYSMTYYILVDNPQMSGSQAIKKSKEMMHGHKFDLFVLDLSFIGWWLLIIVTFGLAAIYVGPYVSAARVNFYEALKAKNTAN